MGQRNESRKEVVIMRKGFWKQLSYEDKFDRKYACWTYNHKGWRKYKRRNRRTARRKLKRLEEYGKE